MGNRLPEGASDFCFLENVHTRREANPNSHSVGGAAGDEADR